MTKRLKQILTTHNYYTTYIINSLSLFYFILFYFIFEPLKS